LRLEEALGDYLGYIKRPQLVPESRALDFIMMMKLYFIVFFFELLLFMPIAQILGFDEVPHALEDMFNNMDSWKVAFLAILAAPIAEEFLFRFHLRYKWLIPIFLFGSCLFLGWYVSFLLGGSEIGLEFFAALQKKYMYILLLGIAFVLMIFFRDYYTLHLRISPISNWSLEENCYRS